MYYQNALLLKNKSIAIFCVFLLFAGICSTQHFIESFKTKQKTEEILLYLPSGKYLSVSTLGYDQFIADLIWIKTTTYFATHIMTDQNYPWLYKMLDTLTSLDKQFAYPYLFGSLVLAMEANQVEKSNLLLKKGMEVFPEDWKFPFYLGFNYYYYLNDNDEAITYMEIAAKNPESPIYIKSFAATLYKIVGKDDMRLRLLNELYNITKNELVKENIKNKIIEILKERENEVKSNG